MMSPEQIPCNPVLEKIRELYESLLAHDGFGEMRMEMRILKFGQKEVILHCGKQYRFVVDFPSAPDKSARTTGNSPAKERRPCQKH